MFKNRSHLIIKYVLFPLLIFGLWNCEKESFITDQNADLEFSTQEVFFDTLFKDLSSATQRFKVYNPHNKPIEINRLQLAGGQNSVYRLNIDGEPTTFKKNLEIRPNDSAFIFAEVTIESYKPSNPFIIKDSILFETNGSTQFVRLKTYGRKAIIHKQEIIEGNQTWQSDTPHLIMGFAAVDSQATLTIEEGTEVYASGNSNFFVFGTLEVNGAAEDKVKFQGTRPEGAFDNQPGQWEGIRFLPSSSNSFMNHSIVTEANVGIEVDSLSLNNNPKLVLLNSRISNMAQTGIAGFSADILAVNTIVSDCCANLVTGIFGGNYQFIHCTFVAANCQCSKEGPALGFNSRDFQGTQFNLNLLLLNSIVYGAKEDELTISQVNLKNDTPTVVNNIVKTTQDFPSNILNVDPQFQNLCNYEYDVIDNSPALDTGRSLGDIGENIPQVQTDYLNENRDTANPDLGAIEHQ